MQPLPGGAAARKRMAGISRSVANTVTSRAVSTWEAVGRGEQGGEVWRSVQGRNQFTAALQQQQQQRQQHLCVVLGCQQPGQACTTQLLQARQPSASAAPAGPADLDLYAVAGGRVDRGAKKRLERALHGQRMRVLACPVVATARWRQQQRWGSGPSSSSLGATAAAQQEQQQQQLSRGSSSMPTAAPPRWW